MGVTGMMNDCSNKWGVIVCFGVVVSVDVFVCFGVVFVCFDVVFVCFDVVKLMVLIFRVQN